MAEQKRPYKDACIGDTYDRLTVVAYDKPASDGKRTVRVDCTCGTKGKRVRAQTLVDKRVKSCGCIRDEKFETNRRRGRWPGFKLRKPRGMEAVA
jgi:hypothetical protein